MRLTSSLKLVGGTYHAQIGTAETEPFTVLEGDTLAKLGEPEIDVGGSFSTEGLEFELDSKDVLFPSGFPVKELFDLSDFEDAFARGNLFLTTVKDRITTAMISKNAAYVSLQHTYTSTDDISTID